MDETARQLADTYLAVPNTHDPDLTATMEDFLISGDRVVEVFQQIGAVPLLGARAGADT